MEHGLGAIDRAELAVDVVQVRALGGGGRHPFAAAGITLAYAATDEFHQSFVTGRNGTPADVLIDAVGVAIAAALYARRRSTRASRAR